MSDHPRVLSKLDFVRRYKAGEFGNASPSWDTLSDYLKSGYKGLVHIRNRIAGGPTWYDVPADCVAEKLFVIVTNGLAKDETLYFSGMAPTEKTLFQGEVCQRIDGGAGLYLFYSTVAKPMRQALAERSGHAIGIIAAHLLRHFMDTASYEWLEELLVRYPGHVIEFSCYDCDWGTIPNRNTVFWETRLY